MGRKLKRRKKDSIILYICFLSNHSNLMHVIILEKSYTEYLAVTVAVDFVVSCIRAKYAEYRLDHSIHHCRCSTLLNILFQIMAVKRVITI